MNGNLAGKHGVAELKKMLTGLQCFRFKEARGMNAVESLEATLQVDPSLDKVAMATLLKTWFRARYTAVGLAFITVPENIRVSLTCRDEAFGSLKPHHFDDARKIEKDLQAMEKSHAFKLSLPVAMLPQCFDPAKA